MRCLKYDATLLEPAGVAAAMAALAPLSTLRNLQVLRFGTDFFVDDAVFAVLSQLTLLTSLSIGRFQLTHPAPGHLPLLQHLQLPCGTPPSQLLRALLPLLPLPALRRLSAFSNAFEHEDEWPAYEVGHTDAATAAVEAAAWRQAAEHLGAAPMLNLNELGFAREGEHETTMAWVDMAAGLRHLHPNLTALSLFSLQSVDPGCKAFSTALPTLSLLGLHRCGLSGTTLAAIGTGWPSLVKLLVNECGGLTPESYLGLAAVREKPLALVLAPVMPASLKRQTHGSQASKFGQQNIMFHDGNADEEDED